MNPVLPCCVDTGRSCRHNVVAHRRMLTYIFGDNATGVCLSLCLRRMLRHLYRHGYEETTSHQQDIAQPHDMEPMRDLHTITSCQHGCMVSTACG